MKQLLNKLPIEIPKRLSLKAMWRLILNRRKWVIGGGIVIIATAKAVGTPPQFLENKPLSRGRGVGVRANPTTS